MIVRDVYYGNNMNTNENKAVEEIKQRLKNARAAAFAASSSDYHADRESAAAELTASLDAYIAAVAAAAR